METAVQIISPIPSVKLVVWGLLMISSFCNAQTRARQPKSEDLNPQFTIYPNPNNGKFSVIVKEIDSSFDVNVYNLIGEMVFHWESRGSVPVNVEVNLSRQPKGIYLVELDTEKANVIRKVVLDNEKNN